MNLRVTALWACLVIAPGGVRAEPARSDAQNSALFPTLASYHEHSVREAQRALEQQLVALPDVARAHVQLERAHPAYVPLDQPLPAPTFRVVLVTHGSGPPADALEGVLKRAQVGAPGIEIELVRTSEAEPITSGVSPPTDPKRDVLRHVLAASLIANVLLATLLLARRKSRLL